VEGDVDIEFFKHETRLNNVYKFNVYFRENTPGLRYEDQPVNAV
jgi:hypothetical protein